MPAVFFAGVRGEFRGRQLEYQPAPPASAEAKPSTSRKNARTPSGSRVKMIACTPVTTA